MERGPVVISLRHYYLMEASTFQNQISYLDLILHGQLRYWCSRCICIAAMERSFKSIYKIPVIVEANAVQHVGVHTNIN